MKLSGCLCTALLLIFLWNNQAYALNSEISCLATNIYHEARGEPIIGQVSVGFVTLNRVKSKRFPNTVCEVITQAKTWKGKPIRDREIYWLALAIYHEARNQSILGQIAVALVILNRVDSERFPDTVLEVVTQGTGKLHRCQFHFYCDGKSDTPKEKNAWNRTLKLSAVIYDNRSNFFDYTCNSMWYHTTAISPHWKEKKHKIITIDDHVFYSYNYQDATC